MKPNHTPIILVSILLAAAIAVSSSPFHDGWAVKYASKLALSGAVGASTPHAALTGASITGHLAQQGQMRQTVSNTSREGSSSSASTAYDGASGTSGESVEGGVSAGGETGSSENTQEATVATTDMIEIKPGFWKNFFFELFGAIETTDTSEATPSTEDGCCADPRLDEMTNTIFDMQSRIDVLENRMNQPCATTAIRTGTCASSCENMGLKCTGAIVVRWKVDTPLFGASTQSVFMTSSTDCDSDWYMSFPEVFDERSCFCC